MGAADDASSNPLEAQPATDRRRPDPRLLELLVCPVTKLSLSLDVDRQELVSAAAGLAFPIRDGVPLLTVEAGRELTPEERSRHRGRD